MNTKQYIRNSLLALLFSASLFCSEKSHTQTFYGYQAIGQQTFMFSLVWQGEPKIGFGYIYRIFGNSFTDVQAEIRFPLKNMFRFKHYEALAGVYAPSALKRTFAGLGGHLRWESNANGGDRLNKLSIAATVIPSYVYAAALDDGLYGTLGLRITYAPVIFAEQGGKWSFFGQHKFEGGIHFDMHIERTLGLAFNPLVNYNLNTGKTFLKEEKPWQIEGDFYFGATYKLNRY